MSVVAFLHFHQRSIFPSLERPSHGNPTLEPQNRRATLLKELACYRDDTKLGALKALLFQMNVHLALHSRCYGLRCASDNTSTGSFCSLFLTPLTSEPTIAPYVVGELKAR